MMAFCGGALCFTKGRKSKLLRFARPVFINPNRNEKKMKEITKQEQEARNIFFEGLSNLRYSFQEINQKAAYVINIIELGDLFGVMIGVNEIQEKFNLICEISSLWGGKRLDADHVYFHTANIETTLFYCWVKYREGKEKR